MQLLGSFQLTVLFCQVLKFFVFPIPEWIFAPWQHGSTVARHYTAVNYAQVRPWCNAMVTLFVCFFVRRSRRWMLVDTAALHLALRTPSTPPYLIDFVNVDSLSPSLSLFSPQFIVFLRLFRHKTPTGTVEVASNHLSPLADTHVCDLSIDP